jgi:hypothetical protein
MGEAGQADKTGRSGQRTPTKARPTILFATFIPKMQKLTLLRKQLHKSGFKRKYVCFHHPIIKLQLQAYGPQVG